MLYPEQIKEQDEDYDRLPLHRARISRAQANLLRVPCGAMKSTASWYESTEDNHPTICEDYYTHGLRDDVAHGMDPSDLLQYKAGGDTWKQRSCEQILL
jgi:hypothetical protein